VFLALVFVFEALPLFLEERFTASFIHRASTPPCAGVCCSRRLSFLAKQGGRRFFLANEDPGPLMPLFLLFFLPEGDLGSIVLRNSRNEGPPSPPRTRCVFPLFSSSPLLFCALHQQRAGSPRLCTVSRPDPPLSRGWPAASPQSPLLSCLFLAAPSRSFGCPAVFFFKSHTTFFSSGGPIPHLLPSLFVSARDRPAFFFP